MSPFLTPELVDRAIDALLPAISAAKDEISQCEDLYIVVTNPTITPAMCEATDGVSLFREFCSKAILRERALTPKANEYRQIALSKAYTAWLYGGSTRQIQRCAPFLVDKDQTIWAGTYTADHLTVAVSGAREHEDEMWATCIHASCRSVSIKAQTDFLAMRKNDENFAPPAITTA